MNMADPVSSRFPIGVVKVTIMSLVPVEVLDGIVRLPETVVSLGRETPVRLIPPTVTVGVPGALAGGGGG